MGYGLQIAVEGKRSDGKSGHSKIWGYSRTTIVLYTCYIRAITSHLRSADAKRQRAKGTVGGRVAVPAHDGHAGLGEALECVYRGVR